MKKIKTILLTLVLVVSCILNAQVAINTDGSDAEASAILDIKSTEGGLLPPRMTEAQMNAINDPVFGLMVMCTNCNPKGSYYFDGLNWVNFTTNGQSGMSETDVYNPATGKIWMDRNLGAAAVATGSTDHLAYGSMYQWGRGSDGHEIINWISSTSTDEAEHASQTNILSGSDTPGHGKFIRAFYNPLDWRIGQNDNLWQGVDGINNPCPSGYRLPTEAEWEAERQSWNSNNAIGAAVSPLKLCVAGNRWITSGVVFNIGSSGLYWASTVDGIKSIVLFFDSSDALMHGFYRANGGSVRCIKD